MSHVLKFRFIVRNVWLYCLSVLFFLTVYFLLLHYCVLQILDDEISADFYVAVPDMLQKLVPLKNKLRKKFPKSKRGTKSEQQSQK